MRKPALILLMMTTASFVAACGGAASWPEKPVPGHPGERVADLAERFVGSPYRYGGTTPYGFDCSGLVMYTHEEAGIDVPRTTAEQYERARQVSTDRMRPGDLLFFRINGAAVSHVGIYVGEGRMIHAPSFGEQVEIVDFEKPYWQRNFTSAGRFY